MIAVLLSKSTLKNDGFFRLESSFYCASSTVGLTSMTCLLAYRQSLHESPLVDQNVAQENHCGIKKKMLVRVAIMTFVFH